MQFTCQYCSDFFPHFKGLLEHYQAKHASKLRRYTVRHKNYGQGIVSATSPDEACKFFDWNKQDCEWTVE